MKEYKVLDVKKKDAEAVMNQMAAQGYKVVAVTYFQQWSTTLVITFEREI